MSDTGQLQHELALIVESEIPLPLSEAPPPPSTSSIAERMLRIEDDLIRKAGGREKFIAETGRIIRAAVDYVIDAPTLRRYSVADLEPDEKTAVGKRIERLLRFHFKIPKGKKLDILLAGEDVDIKTTMGQNWMFSKSSHGHVNLLFAYDETKATFRAGLAYVLDDHLNDSRNRDEKRTLSAEHKANIRWIVNGEPYPPNFLAKLGAEKLEKITSPKTPNARLAALFRTITGVPIPRHAICSIANQKDPMRRIRLNGGARDDLTETRILVLAGTSKKDKALAAALGISLARDEILSLELADPRLSPELVNLFNRAPSAPET